MVIKVYFSTLLNSEEYKEAQNMIICSSMVLWKESTGCEMNESGNWLLASCETRFAFSIPSVTYHRSVGSMTMMYKKMKMALIFCNAAKTKQHCFSWLNRQDIYKNIINETEQHITKKLGNINWTVTICPARCNVFYTCDLNCWGGWVGARIFVSLLFLCLKILEAGRSIKQWFGLL